MGQWLSRWILVFNRSMDLGHSRIMWILYFVRTVGNFNRRILV